VQLYCLRSRHNWGIGDFSDLGQLVENAAAWGAHFVGLNPIHALYPANPESASPYSPSSRRWLNVAYINVEVVPEFLANDRLKAEVANPAFQQHLSELRAKSNVDYTGVIETKIGMLRQVFDQASFSAERQASLDAFVAAGGDAGEFERDADRGGAPGAEEDLVQIAGCEVGEAGGKIDGGAVGVAARAERQGVELRFDGGDDARPGRIPCCAGRKA
jgi:hypothetical protein